MLTTLVVTLWGCGGGEPDPELVLEGEPHIRVEKLGEVPVPVVRLSDGHTPEGVAWQVAEASIATVEEGHVVAKGEGTTEITATWRGQQVSWKLEVAPDHVVYFDKPPAEVSVGQTVKLAVVVEIGGHRADSEAIEYSTSDAGVLTVDAEGAITGVSEGMAYVTAASMGGKTMAELAVVP